MSTDDPLRKSISGVPTLSTPGARAAAVTAADPSARAGSGERVEVPGGLDPALWAAVNAWDAERCRLNELWHGGRCAPCSEAHKVNVAPMLLSAVKAYNVAPASRSPAAGGVAAEGAAIADLREEVAYWRRDATARIGMAAALMRTYRKEGRDDLAYAHHTALGAAVSASEEVRRKDWHARCEICGEPLLPGQPSCGSDDITFAHVRCMVDGDDTPDREDPTDAEWAAATTAGRAAMREDAERPDEPARLPTHRVEAGAVVGDLGGVKAALAIYAAANVNWVGDPQRHIGKLNAAHEGVLNAIRALVTPAGNAAKLVDDLLTAKGDLQYARSHGGPMPGDTVALDAARLAFDAHLAAKDRELDALRLSAPAGAAPGAVAPFQARVAPWVVACFGDEVTCDELERMDRFVEEVFEAVQSRGYDPARIDALKAYVYDREPGETRQEIGGVMMTLAAWCNAIGHNMHGAGEAELTRVWGKVETIRAKQAAKPKGSALPVAVAPSPAAARGPEGVRVLARSGADVLRIMVDVRSVDDTSCRIEVPKGMGFGEALARVVAAQGAIGAEIEQQARCPASRATPDTARPSRAEGDGGQHG